MSWLFTQNSAGELLAMLLTVRTFLDLAEGERLDHELHRPSPLHERAGLSLEDGGRMLAAWSTRKAWNPTPSYQEGSPTGTGLETFPQVLGAVKPAAWFQVFMGWSVDQLREWDSTPPETLEDPRTGTHLAMCPRCVWAWRPLVLAILACPKCEARPPEVPLVVRDMGPRAWPNGIRVLYRDDLGEHQATRTRSRPWKLPSGDWVVLQEGKTGGYLLERFTRQPEINGAAHADLVAP